MWVEPSLQMNTFCESINDMHRLQDQVPYKLPNKPCLIKTLPKVKLN